MKDSGYNRADYSSAAAAAVVPDFVSSDEWKRTDQAERNFINALLRRESGAAISPAEFENAEKQYFPRAGDSAALLAQKKKNRQTVTEGMAAEGRVDEEQATGSTERRVVNHNDLP